jgi:hypothetical protein
MSAPDAFNFSFEPSELNLPALVDAIRKLLLGLPDLTALRAAASPAFWLSTATEVAGMARNLATISMADLLTGAWKQHDRFAKYTDKAQFPRDKVSRIPLATHHIKSTYEPYIQLFVDGDPSGRIPLKLEADVAVEGVILVVQDGRFMRVEAGRARLTGSLKCAETKVCEQSTRDFAWSAGFPFGEQGILIADVV